MGQRKREEEEEYFTFLPFDTRRVRLKGTSACADAAAAN